MKVRPQIMSAVKKNKEREKGNTFYSELLSKALATNSTGLTHKFTDHMDNIIDIRYGLCNHLILTVHSYFLILYFLCPLGSMMFLTTSESQ